MTNTACARAGPGRVQAWLQADYAAIQTLAKSKHAVVHFADEAVVRSDFHAATTWAPRGETPVVAATAQRYGLNMIFAVSRRGQMRFMTVEGNAGKLIEFLKRLLHNAERPLFVIVERQPSHRARKALSSSAPRKASCGCSSRCRTRRLEHNPDELVWNHSKNPRHRQTHRRESGRTCSYGEAHMRSLQKTPALVGAFSHGPNLRYILA